MLNKKERVLVRALLMRVLKSKNGREYIRDKLGDEYVKMGEKLLQDIG